MNVKLRILTPLNILVVPINCDYYDQVSFDRPYMWSFSKYVCASFDLTYNHHSRTYLTVYVVSMIVVVIYTLMTVPMVLLKHVLAGSNLE